MSGESPGLGHAVRISWPVLHEPNMGAIVQAEAPHLGLGRKIGAHLISRELTGAKSAAHVREIRFSLQSARREESLLADR